MNKPINYEKVSVEDWQAVKPGGHKCVIMQVEETQSKTENHYEMLVISFDLDQADPQAGYYKNRYLKDQAAGRDAAWKGKQYLIVDSRTEYGEGNLKRFNTAVLKSNGLLNASGEPDESQIQWGPGYCNWLKNKKIGIVFREEEYTKYDGQFGVAVKPMRFCDYDTALEQPVPKMKFKTAPAAAPSLQEQYQQFQSNPQPQQMSFTDPQVRAAAQQGFMQIPHDALEDEGLPFR